MQIILKVIIFLLTILEYKRVSINATNECCTTERSMTVYLAEEANVDLNNERSFKKTRF